MARTKGAIADKAWGDAVRIAAFREDKDEYGKKRKRLSIIADRLLRAAMDGKMDAIKEVGDRLDGKPHQSADISGAGENGEHIFNILTGVPRADD